MPQSINPPAGVPPSPFFSNVMAQAETLRGALSQYEGADEILLEEFQVLAKDRWLAFIGMGSSLYAPYAATSWLDGVGKWAVTLDASEVLHYHYRGLPPEALPVLVSQSGESAELVRLADLWRGRPFVAITNNLESPLAAGSRLALPLHAGTESATSSKTFVNTVAVALLAAGAAALQRDRVIADLKSAAVALQQTLDTGVNQAQAMYNLLGTPSFLDIVGRGPALGVANQSALILREAAGILGACHSVGLLRHGPLHDIGEGRKVLLFSCRGATGDLARGFANELLARGTHVAWVTDERETPEHPGLSVFQIPGVVEQVFAIPAIAAAELLGCFWASDEGMLPGERVEKITRTE